MEPSGKVVVASVCIFFVSCLVIAIVVNARVG